MRFPLIRKRIRFLYKEGLVVRYSSSNYPSLMFSIVYIAPVNDSAAPMAVQNSLYFGILKCTL